MWLLLTLYCLPGVCAQTWVEDTFEDFADGVLDASGQNIYISSTGTIRSIHRFDLNGDGFVDLLFNSTHNDYTFIPATMATLTNDRHINVEQLAVEGSLHAEVEDLNRDGWLDVVFCPNPSGIQRSRRFVTIIWGGEDGWPAHRSNGILPVHGAKALTAADINGDGWPDIVIINHQAWLPGQPEGNIVRIYWGSVNGFLLSRYRDTGISGAADLASGDFDFDGTDDVAVLSSDSTIHVLHGRRSADMTGDADLERTEISLPSGDVQCITAEDSNADGFIDLAVGTSRKVLYLIKGRAGRNWDDVTAIEGFNASHITVADIDGDSWPDIVLTYFSLVRAGGGEMAGGGKDTGSFVIILWGDSSGFSASRISRLEAQYARASAVTDLDDDGRMDVIIAIHQGKTVYATESAVYFGKGRRQFERGKKGIPTEGAYHVVTVPPEGDRPAGVIFSNSRGGNLREEVPLNLYWGGADGFSPNSRLQIPFRSGYEATAADLNEDGFVDLIAIDEMHGGQKAEEDPYHGANIFWGSAEGFDFENRRTILNERNSGTSNVADLDRDGFLDIVIGFFGRGYGKSTELVIYYGTKDGFDRSRRVALPCEGRSNSPMIADYNKDGWLDIAVNSFYKDHLRIFWGSPGGFLEKNQTIIDVPGIIDLETADLNSDGYLDIIACSYYDRINHHNDTGVLLLWGSSGGFRQWDAQWLPGLTPLAPVVADFDSDGFLDIFLAHYHAELRRELLPSYLYWGGPDGFHTRRRTALINDSAADGLAADFNRDGLLDLAVVNHTVDGSHSKALSKVYYNDGERFTNCSRIEYLPSPGSHWMWNEDMGHIYNRKWEQTYISSAFHWKKKATKGKIIFKAGMPPGTKLIFSVRSASNEESLAEMSWRNVESSGFHLQEHDRYLQYRAAFISDNGDRYPVLDRVVIDVK